MVEWLKGNKLYAGIGVMVSIVAIGYFMFGGIDEIDDDWADSLPTEDPISIEEVVQEQAIVVDIKGAVRFPGVYEMTAGERVIDVIEKAGGLVEEANDQLVNLSMRLLDEMVIAIPFKGEAEGELTVHDLGTMEEDDGKVNINTASETELQSLPGVGPQKALAIIQHREKNGPFNEPADLKRISGIGDKTFEKLESMIKVK